MSRSSWNAAIRRAACVLCTLPGLALAQASGAPQPPAEARDAGFTTLTFDSSPGAASPGQLYPWSFLKYRAAAVRLSKQAPAVELSGGSPYNAEVATAMLTGPGKFTGVAFGGGGYFEATMSFPPPPLDAPQSAWAAFWAMPIEHLAAMPDEHWEGQPPNFMHFAELDVFEYNVHRMERTPNVYSGSLIEWYGVWGQTCTERKGRFCSMQMPYRDKLRPVPPGTDFRQPHRYGVLWIPATSSRPGRMSWYFDGVRVGASLTWPQAPSPSTPPPDGLGYGVLDREHLVFTSGTAAESPSKLYAIRAWQRDTKGNWTGN
jgi:hypothetical protein